jgi:glycosyltransferase involved in cell wall biosynthesis
MTDSARTSGWRGVDSPLFRLRILWQNEHYPDPVKGGGGAVNTYYIVRELGRIGCDPVILARAQSDRSSEEVFNGTRVLRLEPRRLPSRLWPLWPALQPFYLRRQLATVAHTFDAFVCIDSFYALGLKSLFPNRPLVCRVEGTTRGYAAAVPDNAPRPLSSFSDKKVELFRRLLLRQNDSIDRLAWLRSDALVVKSEFMKEDLVRLYRIAAKKVHVVPNGVDHDRYANAQPSHAALERMRHDPGRVVITFCGRLVRMKNLTFLLRAYARMRLRDRCLLLFVGEGDQIHALSALAEELGVGADIRLVGHSDRVEEFLAASHIFVLPSTYEPFGNALLEAMAAGLPCLALRPDGLTVRTASAEIIADGVSGYLVDGRDPNDLAAKLDLLCREPSLRLRLGQAGRRIAAERFSWRRCAEAYLELLYPSTARLQSTHP